MKRAWQIQEAKNRLSEVIECALHDGPQMISRRGKQVAIVVSVEEWKKYARPNKTLVEFFRESPLVGTNLDLDLDRDPDIGRDVDL